MDKKKILIAVIGIILLIAIIITVVIIFNKKDRDYEILNESKHTYFLLHIDDKYGVVDRNGNIIIDPEYENIEIPNTDIGLFITYKENKKEILNEKSENIYNNIDVSVIEVSSDYNEDSIQADTTRLKYKENNLYGLIDFNGNKITEPLYDEIISLPGKYGEYRVKKDNKYGVLSPKGVELVDIKYDFISGDGYSKKDGYNNGGYIVGEKSENGYLYGYIDNNEKEILKMENENIYRVLDMKTEDVYLVVTQNGRSAIYKDKKNHTDYLYMEINYLEDSNMFLVRKNKSYGLLDKDLNTIIEPKYEQLMVAGMYVNASIGEDIYVFDLSGKEVKDSDYIGLEKTSTEKYYIAQNEEGYYGVLDTDMEVVLNLEYDYVKEIENTDLIVATKGDNITIYSANMRELVSKDNAQMDIVNEYIKLTTDDGIIYYTLDGKEVDNKTVYIKNNIYSDEKNGKWGFVDASDNVIVDYKYDRVTEVNEYGFAGIYEDGKWGVINSKGEVILDPTYKIDLETPTFIGKYIFNGTECTNIDE